MFNIIDSPEQPVVETKGKGSNFKGFETRILITWGPGKPPTGHPIGHLTSFCNKVYSCSIPYLFLFFFPKSSYKSSPHNFRTKNSKEKQNYSDLPGHFSNNIRMAEDFSSSMSFICWNWVTSRGVSITHHLIM